MFYFFVSISLSLFRTVCWVAVFVSFFSFSFYTEKKRLVYDVLSYTILRYIYFMLLFSVSSDTESGSTQWYTQRIHWVIHACRMIHCVVCLLSRICPVQWISDILRIFILFLSLPFSHSLPLFRYLSVSLLFNYGYGGYMRQCVFIIIVNQYYQYTDPVQLETNIHIVNMNRSMHACMCACMQCSYFCWLFALNHTWIQNSNANDFCVNGWVKQKKRAASDMMVMMMMLMMMKKRRYDSISHRIHSRLYCIYHIVI